LTQKESCTGEGDIIVCTYQYWSVSFLF
jgi:hypothetical protein